MQLAPRISSIAVLTLASATVLVDGQPPTSIQSIEMPQYSIVLQPGATPRLRIERGHEPVFELPVIAGLASSTQEEHLSDIRVTMRKTGDLPYEVEANAKSTLWTNRRFVWRFFSDHIEFQQFASGHGKLGRNYFLANGVSDLWSNGTTGGRIWDATIYADRYFAPNPDHANQFEFNIAMPQSLGFSSDDEPQSVQHYHPERMTVFDPPPLFLAFHLNKTWTGIGIGAKPGDYQFPSLEYTGSRYAGASLFVDYMGYRTIDGDFESPVLSISFGYSPLDALQSYTNWLDEKGFSTRLTAKDVQWHHLPIFCGWAEQTTESAPEGRQANAMATQTNYEKWLSILEQRGLPVGTVVIDDKWQKNYGTLEVDQQKWPNMKAFVDAQHAKGRYVLLWVPGAQAEGLPPGLCVKAHGECAIADVGNPEYESYLRLRIRQLVQDIGIDGFKEDGVGVPAEPGLSLTGRDIGIEFARRYQRILFNEAHKWKPDAMVETQTVNAAFRESSDLIRLNDLWFGTRNVPEVMLQRARIANITGWPVIDTDNASSTTLQDWWSYMQAQPSIGVPALYFVTRTESTLEYPSAGQWASLAALWQSYVESIKGKY